MTMTVLDRTLVAGDAGGVTGERPEGPDPEVPERARRRGSPPSTNWRSSPPMTRRDRVRRARSCAGRACIPVTSWTGGGLGTAGRWPGRAGPAAARPPTRGMRRSPGCARRRPSWSRSWPRPASWSMCSQNCRRSWRRSPRARTPSPGTVVTDEAIALMAPRIGTRAACAAAGVRKLAGTGGTGSVRCRSGRSRSRIPGGSSRGRWPGRAAGDPGRAAQRPVR